MADSELGILASTFARSSVEANLDAVAEHGLGVVQYRLLEAMRVSVPLVVHGLAESEVPWTLAFLREMRAEVGRCLRSR